MKNTKQLEYVKRTQRNRGKKSDMNRKVWYGKEYVRAGCNSWVKKKSMAKRSARMLKEVLGLENKDKPSLLCITISFIRHKLS